MRYDTCNKTNSSTETTPKDLSVPPNRCAMQSVTVTVTVTVTVAFAFVQFVTKRRPNAQNKRKRNPSKLGLLVDEAVERLQGALQSLLTDFKPISRHVILADLD
jgi:hypothetical protein